MHIFYINKWPSAISIWAVFLLSAASLSGSAPPSFRDESPEPLVFYFANNSSLLMRDYRTNETELSKLDGTLRALTVSSALDSIVIEGNASVIGSFQTNSRLSNDRALAVKSYIRWKHPHIDPEKIYIVPSVFNWDELRERVQQDRLVPYREELLHILSSPLNDQSILAEIKRLGNGTAEDYITNNFSKYMRSATSLVFWVKPEPTGQGVSRAEDRPEEVLREEKDILGPDPTEGQSRPSITDSRSDTPEEVSTASYFPSLPDSFTRKPLFALKTNLLYDLAAALNIAVEVPIGQRWSVSAEWVFPWWLWKKEQYALEIMNGNLEARYWWGNRSGREQMTGWFTGVYGGGGIYDVEWKTKGYQGEFFTGGLTGGFAHKIGRNLRMEYSLGIGYIGSQYREYAPKKCLDGHWHLIRQKSGDFNWIGPTQAKVSLVWMINHNSKKGNKR